MKRGAAETVLLTAILAGCLVLNGAGSRTFFAGAIEDSAGQNPLLEALGETKEVLGDMLYLKSDIYFHGGVNPNLFHQEEHDGEHEDHEEVSAAPDWIKRINLEIHPSVDRHLEADNSKEILPLLYGASRLDPGNPNVALATAYWVQREEGRSADALMILERAAAHNPANWEIRKELGSLLFKKMGRPAEAVGQYEQALALMRPEEAGPLDPVQVRFDLGSALEALGRENEALERYRQALEAYPTQKQTPLRAALEAKIQQLQG